MNTQYLTDEGGRKIAVVLPVQEFEELMEDVSDLAAVAERRGEERVSLAEVRHGDLIHPRRHRFSCSERNT